VVVVVVVVAEFCFSFFFWFLVVTVVVLPLLARGAGFLSFRGLMSMVDDEVEFSFRPYHTLMLLAYLSLSAASVLLWTCEDNSAVVLWPE
jgi:hypothetical protein